jgi:hypothetical protein
MGKRVDHDSTMEVSGSQLVPGPQRPQVPHQPGVSKHDASMWIGGVVGADDFALARKAPKRGRRALIIGASAALAVAGVVGGYLWYTTNATSSTSAAPPSPTTAAAPAKPAVAAVAPADAALAPLAAVDASVAAVPKLEADAVSSVGAPIEQEAPPPKKKSNKKKKVIKKPTKRGRK